ncbi:spore coat protein CotJB [Kroppenstedtia eburnea]|uniref:Spore coat protein JB n=1 Tax=Kroppenstedtia eburnea TaxID=714067 RepID=A0A1N7LH08_9BACL|nr:spore coat protein CotJB [Kroppenstedtia eburnea]EGK07744.1 CotJB protein [Desmospora sp. 8437]QKI81344.1 spore coat protein CotJB [Kroppenstedtia eburnea]SIS73112.1 spore coat protein JB [Kroppenstedtia eburnea]
MAMGGPRWTDEQKKAYHKLMKEIQTVDFVLVELNLYLDTHPDDQQAVQQYNEFVQRSAALKNRFQSMFGPLYGFGNSYATCPWSWKEAPWPWQV